MKIWKTKTTYVDVDTGEIIEKSNVEKNYYITNKHKKIWQNETRGYTQYTIECKRREYTQGELFSMDTNK